jgi:pimeloyl-ACP methyl ester carboxylesterase
VVDALAERFTLYVPDWRGHGASDKPETGYNIADYVVDLHHLLRALELERPLIMGHSLGGIVALYWASRFSGSARKIVAEDAPLRRDPNAVERFDGWIALASQSPEATAAYFAREYPHWSAEECRRRAETITSTHLGVFTELKERNIRDDGANRISPLATIDVPALLVYGDVEYGGMVPAEDAARFVQTVLAATIQQIPGGSHSLHRDQTDAFLDAVVPFLLSE